MKQKNKEFVFFFLPIQNDMTIRVEREEGVARGKESGGKGRVMKASEKEKAN